MRLMLFLLVLLMVPHPVLSAYQLDIDFKGCSADQKKTLRQTFTMLEASLDQLLVRLRQNELGDYLKAWFGNTPASAVEGNFRNIHDLLRSQQGISVVCDEYCEDASLSPFPGKAVRLCNEFFGREPASGYESQTGELFYALSHTYGGTINRAYGLASARVTAHNNPEKALSNAQNHQYFYEAVTGTDVMHPAAAWNEANSCEWAYDNVCDEAGTSSCSPGTDTLDCTNHPPVVAETQEQRE